VNWNPHRQRWILVATQQGGTRTRRGVVRGGRRTDGTLRTAKKIVTHDRYTFYNPVHHPFFDRMEAARSSSRAPMRTRSRGTPTRRRNTTTTRS
jgi:hypothetical protein